MPSPNKIKRVREIPLTRGYVALIDEVDFELVSKYSWQAFVKKHTVYALTSIFPKKGMGGRRGLRMHRLIMDAPGGQWVDHINGNGLDNRRSNLRFCTPSENTINSGMRRDNTSGVKGVLWVKRFNRWYAVISKDKVHIHLGSFRDKSDAIAARKRGEIKYFGEFVRKEPDIKKGKK